MQFNEVVDLLDTARRTGIEILVTDENTLRLKVSNGIIIDPDFLKVIRDNKDAIIELLGNREWQSRKIDRTEKIPVSARKANAERIPLSFSQERLWFIDQLEGSIAYHTPAVIRLQGKLNIAALESALKHIVDRHEILRTVIKEEEGRPYQEVLDTDGWRMMLIEKDRYGQDADALPSFVRQLVKEPFGLSSDHKLRAHLIGLQEEEYLLVLVMHHIASDGWSASIIIRELRDLYQSYVKGIPSGLEPLPIQYSDYAIWQRKYLDGPLMERKISYWREQLGGVKPLELLTDYERSFLRSAQSGRLSKKISNKITDELLRLSNQEGVSLFMTLLAAFKIVLFRYSGSGDICIGTSIAGRQQEEITGLVGFFANTLAFRSELHGDMKIRQFLQQIKKTTLDGYDNQEVPFEKVVEILGMKRKTGSNPVFQAMLVLENMPEGEKSGLAELQIGEEPFELVISKFDLTLTIQQSEEGLYLSVTYRSDLYRASTMERLLMHYENILNAMIADLDVAIGRLNLVVTAGERELLESFSNMGLIRDKNKTVVDLFEEQVERTPDALAVVYEGEKLTYRELNVRSNQLARHLRHKGVKKETVVPLCIDRSLEMLIALWGILKAGGAYVPIDPQNPDERIRYVLEDVKSPVIIIGSGQSNKIERIVSAAAGLTGSLVVDIERDRPIWTIEGEDSMERIAGTEDLIYVIYTSGSTGRPKGVMITHNSVADYLYGLSVKTPIRACKSFALVSTLSADLGNTVIYSALTAGGALHVISHAGVSDDKKIKSYFKEHGIECLKIVPSHWQALSMGECLLLPDKLLLFGGETLSREITERIQLAKNECTIINHYGPTETTIGKLIHRVDPETDYGANIPIGRPFSNTSIYILDPWLGLCPIGVSGEICIGGEGIFRGYLNAQELTAGKLIKNFYGKGSGSLLYRTGDRGRWLPDGNIEFRGRWDEQVKIRGYRIELGEIETALQETPGVSQAVVTAKEDRMGERRLTAYIVPEGSFDKERIYGCLKDRLPEYMLPSVLIEMTAIPLTDNGKVDRKKLTDWQSEEIKTRAPTSPRTKVELKLTSLWQELLGVGNIGTGDDFFELGGHSLLAVRVISAIRKELGIEASIGDLFDFPTVESLAGRLSELPGGTVLPPIVMQERTAFIPLSFSQERLWFIDQLSGSVAYHIPTVLRLRGRLHIDGLIYALGSIVNRHESLRTVIGQEDGRAWQSVLEKDTWKLNVLKGESGPIEKKIAQLIGKPFDLSADHMLRADLIELEEEEYILVVTLHHIASDGWSGGIMVKEFVTFYHSYTEGIPAALPPLPIQYADYAIWQRKYIEGDVLNRSLAYWQGKLKDIVPLNLTTDHRRPAEQSMRGAQVTFKLDKDITEGIRALSRKQSCTLYMTLLATFTVLLYRYSDQKDISIGSPIAGRTQQEIEGLIGFFVNMLVLRSDLGDNPAFTGLLQQVKITTREAFEHQVAPFERVVEALARERDMSKSPLFQVMFELQNSERTGDANGNHFEALQISKERAAHETSKFDLSLLMTEETESLSVTIEYNTDLYQENTIRNMGVHYETLLSSVVKNPAERIAALRMLPEAEERQLAVSFNDTTTDYCRDSTLPDLFEKQASLTPDNIALTFEGVHLTYRELDERSNQLGHYLRDQGIREDSLVLLCMDRSIEMLIGILGILKAGGAYVPVDPEYPADRMRIILEDTAADIAVSSGESVEIIKSSGVRVLVALDTDCEKICREPKEKVERALTYRHLAHVIYTSGSTGRPKGVMINHKNLVNLLSGMPRLVEFTGACSFLSVTTFSFDIAYLELYLPLITGGKIIMLNRETGRDGNRLAEQLSYHRPTHMQATPTNWQILLEGGWENKEGVKMLTAGEPISNELKEKLTGMGMVWNLYGPTETTIYSTCKKLQKGEKVLIGHPIANTSLYITGSQGELLPRGAVGEMCIAGEGVAIGYLNQPELTADKFIKNLFHKTRGPKIYRTGDRGRWLPDGNIEFFGRQDEQVKIRGYRIELGEIERVLLESPQVRQAAVLARADRYGHRRLVGYVVAEGEYHKEKIIHWLRSKLPAYMVPALLIALESLPESSNGKINKKGLPDPDISGQLINLYAAPRTSAEMTLAAIWQKVLNLERVGVHDNFFELGGHSLLAMQVASAIKKELAVEVPVKIIFQLLNIESIADYIQITVNNAMEESEEYETVKL